MNSTGTLIATLAYLLSIAICIVALFVVPVNRKPSSATAWLMLIFGLPYLGALLFFMLGSPKLSRRRRAQQRTMDDMLRKTVADARQRPELQAVFDAPILPRYEPFVQRNANLGGLPAVAGNRVELLSDYAGAVDRIVQAIEGAQHYVHVEYYIFADDATGGKVVDALIDAQQRGVACRVLIDHIGNSRFNRTVLERLRAGDVAAHLMLPMRIFDGERSRFDLRNHRKIVVVDGEVGFTGSQNLIDRDYHKRSNREKGLYYIELVARVSGPVVRQLNAAFLTDWYAETDMIPDPIAAPEIHAAVAPQTAATLTDYTLEMHDRIMTQFLSQCKQGVATETQNQGPALRAAAIGKALITARDEEQDSFTALQTVMPWERFVATVTEAETLLQPKTGDYLDGLGAYYPQLRKYSPLLLDTFTFAGAPSGTSLLKALQILQEINAGVRKKVPRSAPRSFVMPRWADHVITPTGIDRQYYEFATLHELRNHLRAGDVWVRGSRQFRGFDDYLIPPAAWAAQKQTDEWTLAVP